MIEWPQNVPSKPGFSLAFQKRRWAKVRWAGAVECEVWSLEVTGWETEEDTVGYGGQTLNWSQEA